jgi:hypothetical protein
MMRKGRRQYVQTRRMLRCTANAGQDKKLLRKLDFKLIPWLSFLYLICRL